MGVPEYAENFENCLLGLARLLLMHIKFRSKKIAKSWKRLHTKVSKLKHVTKLAPTKSTEHAFTPLTAGFRLAFEITEGAP